VTNNRSEFVVDLLRKYRDGQLAPATSDGSADAEAAINRLSMMLGCPPDAGIVVYRVKAIVDTLPFYRDAVNVRDHMKKKLGLSGARSDEIVKITKEIIPYCDWEKAHRIYGIMKQFGLVKVVGRKETTHGTREAVEIV